MARFLRLIARWTADIPLLVHLARRLFPSPFRFVSGKPMERWLLTYDLGGRCLALANDAETVESVMLDRQGVFPKSTVLESLLQPLIGRGVFGRTGGAEVKAARRLFIHALARVSERTIAADTQRLTETYADRWLQTDGPAVVPIGHELSRLTVDIVSQCTLNERFDAAESDRFARLFHRYHRQCLPLSMLFSDGSPATREKLVRRMGLEATGGAMRNLVARRFLDPLITGSVETLNAPFAVSLADAGLLQHPPESPERSRQALDEIMVMLLAGHETTASVLSWLLWELARRPLLQDFAAALLAAGPVPVWPEAWSGIDADTLLRGLSKEALRLYPPIAFFLRETTRDVCPRGKAIPAGSQLVVAPWMLQRHRKKWDRPDDFLPERWWLGGTEPDRSAYLPFGMGPRACPGARFADIEMREILRVLLSRCRFTLTSARRPQPLGALTSRPDREILLSIAARRRP